MSTVIEILDLIAPTFASLSTADKNKYIALAQCEVSETVFGDCYNKATAFYTAHLIAMSQSSAGSVGSLTMEKEGDLARQYSNTQSSELSNTQYLDAYNRMLKNRVPKFIINSSGCIYG